MLYWSLGGRLVPVRVSVFSLVVVLLLLFTVSVIISHWELAIVSVHHTFLHYCFFFYFSFSTGSSPLKLDYLHQSRLDLLIGYIVDGLFWSLGSIFLVRVSLNVFTRIQIQHFPQEPTQHYSQNWAWLSLLVLYIFVYTYWDFVYRLTLWSWLRGVSSTSFLFLFFIWSLIYSFF